MKIFKLGVVMHACSPNIREAETGLPSKAVSEKKFFSVVKAYIDGKQGFTAGKARRGNYSC